MIHIYDEGQGYYSHPAHATDPETPHLWHQRLGHVNIHDLQQLVKHGKITLHSDLCGPYPVMSIGDRDICHNFAR
jgi:phospholipase C